MTRRRAVAAVVIVGLALMISGAAWRMLATKPADSDRAPASREFGASAAVATEHATSLRDAPPSTHAAQSARPRRAPVEKPIDPPMKTLVRGRAVFEDGRPAVGARLRAFCVRVESDEDSGRAGPEVEVGADGRFEIVAPEQCDAPCVVYGVLRGYAFASATATISHEDVTLTFVRGGVVIGTVYDERDKPMSAVEVRLVRCSADGQIKGWRRSLVWLRPDAAAFCNQTARTDGAGRFRFEGAPLSAMGRHSVVVVDGPDEGQWRSDVATFETSGETLVRDVHVGLHAFDGHDPFRKIEGRVVDAEGLPIEDAEVLYGAFELRSAKDVKYAQTDNAGRFVIDLGDEFERDGRTTEVRVGAAGYRAWRGAPEKPTAIVRVKLTRWDHEPRPGRLVGVAVDRDDRPVTGEIEVDLMDDLFRHDLREHVFADSSGTFTIAGLWPGRWRVWFDGSDALDVEIRDADEPHVRVRGKHEAAWFSEKRMIEDEEKEIALIQELEERAKRLKAADESTKEVESKIEDAKTEIARLEGERRHASSPTRDFVVTGLPRDGCYVVRAKCAEAFRSAEAEDGAARFSKLSTGLWEFVVERFGVPTIPRVAEVVKGDGAQTYEFPATR